MAADDSKKKAAVAGLASILLVAAVIAVSVGSSKNGGDISSSGGDADDGSGGITTSTKAVEAICSPTSYKDTCEKSLADANTTDTKQLVEIAINVTVAKIAAAMKNSTLLQEAANDPSTKEAFKVCEDVLERAAADLRRSAGKVGAFDFTKADEIVADLRTWLSAVVTNQETCVDAFGNTTGDTGERMKKLLRTAREMSSNGLAMVTDISTIIGALQLGSLGSSRRLLSEAEEDDGFISRRLLQANTLSLTPNIVVAQDGSGDFKTVNEAVAMVKIGRETFTVIRVKAGVYNEYVSIPKGKNKVVMIGDGPEVTKITGNRSMAGGVPTFYTATVDVNSEEFIAQDMGFENTAGVEGHEAIALRVSGDKAILFNVRVDGNQDSLYADVYRQYYRNCTITGTVNFVIGNAVTLFQDCTFIARKPSPGQDCVVTAHGRNDSNSNTAFVIQNGHITADPALLDAQPPVRSYLGRPWKEYSRTIIMHANIDGFVDPTGWSPWMGNIGLNTSYYGEYENTGPGSKLENRVTWPGIHKITTEIAQTWTGSVMYGGDAWITESGVLYNPNLKEA
ncbi:hypothetical protein C2S52_011384 [Perilla frutescens var. hirtella]|nr:hypothetical protein C2S52_011384 [Perilla frutescens var. hirtella]